MIMHLTAIALPGRELKKITQLSALTRIAGFELLKRIDDVSPSALKLDINSTDSLSVIFVVDIMPLPPSLYNEIENTRLLVLHKELRKLRSPDRRKLLSSDTTIMAARCQYIDSLSRLLLSEKQRHEMLSNADTLNIKYKTDDEVVKILRNSFRGKIEVIRKNKQQMVKKTFRAPFVDHLDREIKARLALAHLPEISPIIDSGEYYLTMPYYTHIDLLANPYKPFPLAQARTSVSIMETIWNHGYAMLDSNPANFLYLPDNTIKVIDLEFTIEHRQPDIKFSDSFFFAAKQSPLTTMAPMDAPWSTWHTNWRPLTGIDYADIDKDNAFRYIKYRVKQIPRLWTRQLRNKRRIYHQRNIRTDAAWHYLPLNKRYYF